MLTSNIIHTIDSHTGGEPTRLIVSGIPLSGASLLEQREYMRKHNDHLRSALMCEPRGHRGMFGAILAPATRPEVDFGIIWVDSDGSYLNMCGHGTIGIGISAVECGLVRVTEPKTEIKIDMPAGLVEVSVAVENGRGIQASFTNVPAFSHTLGALVEVPAYGKVPVDISFGGNFFGAVKAEDLGIEVRPELAPDLVRAGLAVRDAINAQISVQHPTLDHIRKVDLVTIYQAGKTSEVKYKNIHVFSDGSFDRSPGGTGTSHMMAMLIARGDMKPDETIVSEGILGTRFRGRMVGRTKVGKFDAFIPEISGQAFMTGMHQFVIDPRDKQRFGFHVG